MWYSLWAEISLFAPGTQSAGIAADKSYDIKLLLKVQIQISLEIFLSIDYE